MATLPDVSMDTPNTGTGAAPANNGNTGVVVGVCSKGVPNRLYSIGAGALAALQEALGSGPAVEEAALICKSASVLVMPVTPSAQGTVSAVSHDGTGVGTVAPTRAPDRVIKAKVTTGGAIGTAAFSFSVDGGDYGTPVTSVVAAPWSYAVPGTVSTLVFSAATYVANDVYTVSTAGAVTIQGSGTASWVTCNASPLDAYRVWVEILSTGTLGTASFRWSLDGGSKDNGRSAANWSPEILIPSSTGVYVIPGTGIVLTFAGAAGAFVDGDLYKFTSTPAGYSSSDLTTTLTALHADPHEWGYGIAVGTPTNAAASATVAAAIDTSLQTMRAAYRFGRFLCECPQTETDSAIISAFAAVSSAEGRVAVGCGDVDVASPLSGRVFRRNVAWVAAARMAKVPVQAHLGKVIDGALEGVSYIYRDERATPGLDAARFITPRTIIGEPGYFITRDCTMAAPGTWYARLRYGRIADRACNIARPIELKCLNDDVELDPDTGFIDAAEANEFESAVERALKTELVDTKALVKADCTISRTTDLRVATEDPVSITLYARHYREFIKTTVVFANS